MWHILNVRPESLPSFQGIYKTEDSSPHRLVVGNFHEIAPSNVSWHGARHGTSRIITCASQGIHYRCVTDDHHRRRGHARPWRVRMLLPLHWIHPLGRSRSETVLRRPPCGTRKRQQKPSLRLRNHRRRTANVVEYSTARTQAVAMGCKTNPALDVQTNTTNRKETMKKN